MISDINVIRNIEISPSLLYLILIVENPNITEIGIIAAYPILENNFEYWDC